MRRRGWGRPGNKHALGVVFLTFGLVHVPLPQADFHNIRHHDAPGELCVYHDHLLQWHPGAGSASDVAVLHWHWVLPSVDGSERDGMARPDGSTALHAHMPDWPHCSGGRA